MTVPAASRPPRGRAGDLAKLCRALDDARQEPVVVTVTGEAGIGKTTLLDAFAQAAKERGAAVLQGGSTIVAGEPIQYAAISQALRGTHQDDRHDGEQDPPNRAEYFERILQTVAAQHPGDQTLVMILEDVHWADAGTLELVAFLSRNLPAGHLIVLSYRDDQELLDPGARFVLAGMTSDSRLRQIELNRLDARETAALAQGLRGSALSPTEATALFHRSSGNPFIATELVNAEIAGRVPTRLQDVLLVRTRELGDDAMAIVQTLALLGRPAPHSLLPQVLGLVGRPLAAAINECISRGVVVIDQPSSGYRFRHNLTQDAVIQTMLPGVQEDLHFDLAQALASQPEVSSNPSAAAEWASHLHASGRIPESARAAMRAAAVARPAFAYDEVWRQLRRIVDYWRGGATPQALGLDDLAGFLEDAGEAARWAGDSVTAAELEQESLQRQTTPQARARVGERLGRSLWDLGRGDEARAAYDAAAALAYESGDLALIATITASQARLAMLGGEYAAAIEQARAAAELATKAGVESERGRALSTLGAALFLHGDLSSGLGPLRTAVAIAKEHGDLEDLRRATGNLAYGLMLSGRTQEAAEVAVEGMARARRYNLIASTGAALVTNAIVLLGLAGRLDEAERLYDDAIREGITNAQALLVHVAGAEVDLVRGRVMQARAKVDQALELQEAAASAQISADLLICDAAVCLAEGRHEKVQVLMDEALQVTDGTDEHRERLRACDIGLRALVPPSGQPGRPKHADERRLDRLLRAARESKARAGTKEHQAYWLTCTAEAALAGRTDSRSEWRHAAECWRDCERPVEQGWALLRLAEATMSDDRAAALTALQEARAIAEELSIPPLLDETAALARRARVKLEDTSAPGLRGALGESSRSQDLGLTEREREVLELLVAGHTNKDIAAQLFLSPRTVGVHVSNLLRKLDATTRGQAAAIARERRLVEDSPADGR